VWYVKRKNVMRKARSVEDQREAWSYVLRFTPYGQELAKMSIPLEKFFAGCLVFGCALALLQVLTAGRWSRLPWPLGRLRLRVRLPRLPRLRVRLRLLRTPLVPRPQSGSPVPGKVPAEIPGELAWAGPLMVGIFLTLLGAAGLVAQVKLHFPPWPSLLTAVGASAGLTALLILSLARVMMRSAVASEVRGTDLVGTVGEVSLAIPEDGVGTLTYIGQGRRVAMPARSADGSALSQGTRVMIVRVENHVAYVEEL
jgi:membrane protein implicated in regulation of membrane protease activity